MVCAIHWFGYYFESELISFYEHCCLYESFCAPLFSRNTGLLLWQDYNLILMVMTL